MFSQPPSPSPGIMFDQILRKSRKVTGAQSNPHAALCNRVIAQVSYVVRFKPDARIDYSYDLVVVTEREKFSVPIRASGGSALLDFPDVVDFGDDCVVGCACDGQVSADSIRSRASVMIYSS